MGTEPKVNFNLPAKDLIDQPAIRESFISVLVKIHGKSEGDADMIFEKELLYYRKALFGNPKLSQCTGISLYSAFLEIAINGLSIQPGGKSEAFLESRGSKDGKDDKNNDKWVQVARFVITAYGELSMRIRAGQIIRMNNPQVIYEGDRFQPRTNEQGVLMVDYAPAIPRKSKKIIGCYTCIVLPGNQYDFKWLLEDDIQRLARYSVPRFGDNPQANALYSSNEGQIDPGFLEAKTIKHAMRAYSKLRTSDTVSFDGDDDTETPGNTQPYIQADAGAQVYTPQAEYRADSEAAAESIPSHDDEMEW
jgi:recombinational DNA repair protein RecT